jgi:uncharacterized coiled-coil protein SlyX
MRDGMTSPRNIIDILRTGETSEVVAYYPEMKPLFDEYKSKFDNLISLVENEKTAAYEKRIKQLEEMVEKQREKVKEVEDTIAAYEKKAELIYSNHNVVKDAIERTHDIAHNLIGDVEPDTTVKLPSSVIPQGMTAFAALVEKCKEGLRNKHLDNKQEYVARLKEELKIIKDKEFATYFLTMKIISDIANKTQLVGSGRGCFLPDTRIKMSDGFYSPISLVNAGDIVIDAHGNKQKVTDVLTYKVNEEIIELEFENSKKIRCTKDHKFLTANRGWIEAQNLSDNDEIVEV